MEKIINHCIDHIGLILSYLAGLGILIYISILYITNQSNQGYMILLIVYCIIYAIFIIIYIAYVKIIVKI